MKQSKILSVLLAVLTACLVLSSSVAVPILCRPFYYAHIGPLGLVQATGLTEEAIRQAYDEMLRAGQHIGCLMDAVRIYALGIIELDDILHAAPAQGV